MASKKTRDRILTELLKQTGDDKVILEDGTETTYSKHTARLVWEMASRGSVRFDDGRLLKSSARDWQSTVSFIYNQIDGPAKTEQDVNMSFLEKELAGLPDDELAKMAKNIFSEAGFDITSMLEEN